jgi:hypothetical protein
MDYCSLMPAELLVLDTVRGVAVQRLLFLWAERPRRKGAGFLPLSRNKDDTINPREATLFFSDGLMFV